MPGKKGTPFWLEYPTRSFEYQVFFSINTLKYRSETLEIWYFHINSLLVTLTVHYFLSVYNLNCICIRGKAKLGNNKHFFQLQSYSCQISGNCIYLQSIIWVTYMYSSKNANNKNGIISR